MPKLQRRPPPTVIISSAPLSKRDDFKSEDPDYDPEVVDRGYTKLKRDAEILAAVASTACEKYHTAAVKRKVTILRFAHLEFVRVERFARRLHGNCPMHTAHAFRDLPCEGFFPGTGSAAGGFERTRSDT